jgi:uncharacterized membrane protein YqjE
MDRTNGSRDRAAGLLDRTREEARYFWSDAVDIRADLQELAAKEVELFQAEVKEQVSLVTRSAIFGGIAAVFGLLLLSFAFVTLMYVLAEFMETWTAALITTGIIALLTSIIGLIAYQHMRRVSFTPKRTMNSLKEDAQWARDLLTSSKR